MNLLNLTLGTSVTLSHDLLWTDEHAWSPVVSNVEYSLTGALIVESAVRQKGRPLTLSAPDPSMAWHARSVIDTLYLWSKTPGQQFTLTLDDGRIFNVAFRHQDAPAMEAKPVCGFPTWEADGQWQVSLKFMEV